MGSPVVAFAGARPQPKRSSVGKPLLWVAGGAATIVSFIFLKPFAMLMAYGKGGMLLDNIRHRPSSSKAEDERRQGLYERYIADHYLKKGDGTIDWWEFADIIEVMARLSPSDSQFQKDVWSLFGWKPDNTKSIIHWGCDPKNTGLPARLHNSDRQGRELYAKQQMYHYLGGAIGNYCRIPSHLLNNPIFAVLYECLEWAVRGRLNWGDIRLFNVAQPHRDDYIRNGRMTLAPNIRNMLSGGA